MSKELNKIVDELSSLTIMETAELAKLLEEKWGVTAAAPVAVAAMPGAAAAAVTEEKTEFSVILTAAGSNKITVIKEVRRILPDLDLKDAKELVDSAPKPIKEKISKDEANEIKKALEAAGASVEVK